MKKVFFALAVSSLFLFGCEISKNIPPLTFSENPEKEKFYADGFLFLEQPLSGPAPFVSEKNTENLWQGIYDMKNGEIAQGVYAQFPQADFESKLDGIFMYLHGAAAKPADFKIHPQGILTDENHFEGNFGNLRREMKERNFLYLAPEFTDFENEGQQNILTLTNSLKKKYPETPIYLAGASAGGRLALKTAQAGQNLFDGLVLLCPAVSESDLTALSLSNYKTEKIWITGATNDPVVSTETLTALSNLTGPFKKFEILEGNHDTPVSEINWAAAINFLAQEK